MSGPEDRQAKALEAIAGYMKQLVPTFKTINDNLVEFAKLVKPEVSETAVARSNEPKGKPPYFI